MKFQNLFLFLFFLSTSLIHGMEENVAEITKQLETIHVIDDQPTSPRPTQAELKQILKILALREKVTKLLYYRCSMSLSMRIVTEDVVSKFSQSQKAILRAFQEAEIAYSLANNTTQTMINIIEKEALIKSNDTTASYTSLKVGLNLLVLSDETSDPHVWLQNVTEVFHKNQIFFDSYLTHDALCYKDSISKKYQRFYQNLAKKPPATSQCVTSKCVTSQSIYSLDSYIYNASKEMKLTFFHFFFTIHTLVLKDLIVDKIATLQCTNQQSQKSNQQIKLKHKIYQKKIDRLNTGTTTTIKQAIDNILQSPLDTHVEADIVNLLDMDRIKDTKPAYYKYLKYFKVIFSSFSISKIISPHTDKKIETIANDNQFIQDLIFEVFKQLQRKPKKAPQSKKLTKPSKRRKRRKKIKKQIVQEQEVTNPIQKKSTSQPLTIKKKSPTEAGPKITPAKHSHIETTVKKNNRKRTRKRNKKKNCSTTQPATDNQQTNLTVEQAKKENFLERVVISPLTSIPLINDTLTYLEQHYINPSSDIIHKETTVYVCILDLIRALFKGYQNKIFILKNSHPLPFNPLKNITYSKYVLDQKMSREHDNNHAFSPLVREYGQHGYIQDQELSDIQKKSLGTKHKIKNSTQYKLLHTVYLPARIASLGYPIEHFEKNGCTANGEFEFTFVRKDHRDPGICIHRFFRPYN